MTDTELILLVRIEDCLKGTPDEQHAAQVVIIDELRTLQGRIFDARTTRSDILPDLLNYRTALLRLDTQYLGRKSTTTLQARG